MWQFARARVSELPSARSVVERGTTRSGSVRTVSRTLSGHVVGEMREGETGVAHGTVARLTSEEMRVSAVECPDTLSWVRTRLSSLGDGCPTGVVSETRMTRRSSSVRRG